MANKQKPSVTPQTIATSFPRRRGWTDWYQVANAPGFVRFYIANGKAIRTEVRR